jgi:hypothetical protein
MNHLRIFNEIKADFGEQIALNVCQINAICLTTKVKRTDINGRGGSFTKRVIKKAKKFLWESSPEELELSLALWGCAHDWQIKQSLDGLGGCEKKTFKELLDARNK